MKLNPAHRTSRWKAAVALPGAALLTIGLAACGSSGGGSNDSGSGSSESAGGSNSGQSVNIVAYSVAKPPYDALTAAFNKTSAGKGVEFKASYGASGTQSKNVAAGTLKADYAAFSLGSDLTKLVPKYVDESWNAGANKGLVSRSVVVIVVKKGNPLKITGWDDLIKDGVKIVTPDPSTSGAAKWNIMAAYQHVIQDGGTAAEAEDYLTKFYKNIVSRAASGAAATTQFEGGTGDVLISYENEAIGARQAGNDLDYIVPDESISIDNPAAVTKEAPSAAKAFLDFVLSDAGQKVFISKGFRPVSSSTDVGNVPGANDPSKPFPTVKKLFTIDDLGGWDKVNTDFFGTDGIVTKIAKG